MLGFSAATPTNSIEGINLEGNDCTSITSTSEGKNGGKANQDTISGADGHNASTLIRKLTGGTVEDLELETISRSGIAITNSVAVQVNFDAGQGTV